LKLHHELTGHLTAQFGSPSQSSDFFFSGSGRTNWQQQINDVVGLQLPGKLRSPLWLRSSKLQSEGE
jgi:hypothetical protein